jgi:cytochrome c oxidase assembly protein subunit 15
LLVLVAATLVAGTVVTGSGPHSGDPAAGRTGLDPAAVSQLHADLVFLLVGVSVAFWVALRAIGGPSRPMGVFLAVVLAQGLVGFVQYWTDLPVLLVGLHLVGACLVLVTAVQAVLALRDRGPLGAVPAPTATARELAPA